MPLFSMVHSSSSRMQRLIVCILTVNANCLMLLLFSVPTIDIGKDWGENYVFWEVFMFFCEMFEVLSYSLCTLAPNTVFFVVVVVCLFVCFILSSSDLGNTYVFEKQFTNRFRIFFRSRS